MFNSALLYGIYKSITVNFGIVLQLSTNFRYFFQCILLMKLNRGLVNFIHFLIYLFRLFYITISSNRIVESIFTPTLFSIEIMSIRHSFGHFVNFLEDVKPL